MTWAQGFAVSSGFAIEINEAWVEYPRTTGCGRERGWFSEKLRRSEKVAERGNLSSFPGRFPLQVF